jgi:hypothetical protein
MATRISVFTEGCEYKLYCTMGGAYVDQFGFEWVKENDGFIPSIVVRSRRKKVR